MWSNWLLFFVSLFVFTMFNSSTSIIFDCLYAGTVHTYVCVHVHAQVMHDEAVTNAVPVMNQMTIGLDFLNRTLGVRPQIGWHIGEVLTM